MISTSVWKRTFFRISDLRGGPNSLPLGSVVKELKNYIILCRIFIRHVTDLSEDDVFDIFALRKLYSTSK